MTSDAVLTSVATGYKASTVLLVVGVFVFAVHFIWQVINQLLMPNIKAVRRIRR